MRARAAMAAAILFRAGPRRRIWNYVGLRLRGILKILSLVGWQMPSPNELSQNLGDERGQAAAAFLVSAIQMSCNARLVLACRLLGSLFKTLAVLCTQQRCARVFGHTSSIAFQKPSAPSATACCGSIVRPRRLRSSCSSF